MKKCLVLFLLTTTLFAAVGKVSHYTTIQVVVNIEKFYELPVYQIYGQQEKYVLLKDLAKIFSATLTYYPVGKYISFNCRGEKIYFYFDKDYFIWSNKAVGLSSKVINYKNRTFVPINILNNSIFADIINANIEYRKNENVLIINWIDSVVVSYYVTKDEAKVEYKYLRDVHYEYSFDLDKIFVTFLSAGKIQPKEFKIEGGIISKIVLTQQNSDVLSEIHIVEKNVEVKTEKYKNKLVIYISAKKEEKQKYVTSTTLQKNVDQDELPVVKTDTQKIVKYDKVIVIDPGHGGEDSGAVGKYGTKEKDVNLAIAKKIKQKLIEEGFEKVLLTREEDIFIPLVKRTEFANVNNADIFISIHCNASEKPTGTDEGFEVYFLSEKATDPDAVATEKLENEVVKFEKQTEELTRLQKILWSMIVNEFINESSKLCSLIGKEVTSRTKQNYRGVKQAGFYVLRGAQMPAVLVECGFISNPNEELRLNHENFQWLIAQGIASAIKKYYENKNNK